MPCVNQCNRSRYRPGRACEASNNDRRDVSLPVALFICTILFFISLAFTRLTIESKVRDRVSNRLLEHFGIEPEAILPLAPGCTTFAPFLNDSTVFASNIHQLSIAADRLRKSDIEGTLMDSDFANRYAKYDHFRTTKVMTHMLRQALVQYIRKASPPIEQALTQSNSIVSRLISRPSSTNAGVMELLWKIIGTQEYQIEDSISRTFEAYTDIQQNLGPHNDLVYRIVNSFQEYLADLAVLVPSSTEACEVVGFKSSGTWAYLAALWKHLGSIWGTDEASREKIDDCNRQKLLEARLVDYVLDLQDTIYNLRNLLDDLQDDIDDLGEQALHFLLAGVGRSIPAKQYVDIMSALSRGCSRVRGVLGGSFD